MHIHALDVRKALYSFWHALLRQMHVTHTQISYKDCVVLEKCPIMSLVIVPHQGLTYQLMHWICMLWSHHLQSPLDSIVQVCIHRNTTSLLDSWIKMLWREVSPIIISIPQALVEILEAAGCKADSGIRHTCCG